MSGIDVMRRQRLLALAFAPAALLVAGCASRGKGESPSWWELDPVVSPGRAAPDAARSRLSLSIEGASAGSLYDGTALLFSRSRAMRSPYQYANWVERPPNRIARLAQRSLQARGGFRDVAVAESGLRPDLLLTLTVEGFQYNLAAQPAVFEVTIAASLMDWKNRRLLAASRFSTAEPSSAGELPMVIESAGRATARVLEDLAPWVEARAAELKR